jgi:chromosome segregation ATPase
VRTTSANLRRELDTTNEQLDKEKTKHENTRKEFEELKKVQQELILQIINEHQMSHIKLNKLVQQMLETDENKMKSYLDRKFCDLKNVLEEQIMMHVKLGEEDNNFSHNANEKLDHRETSQIIKRQNNNEEEDKKDEIVEDGRSGEDHGKTMELQEKIEELNNKLNRVQSENISANLECNQLKEKLKFLERKQTTNLHDRSTSPMETSAVNSK